MSSSFDAYLDSLLGNFVDVSIVKPYIYSVLEDVDTGIALDVINSSDNNYNNHHHIDTTCQLLENVLADIAVDSKEIVLYYLHPETLPQVFINNALKPPALLDETDLLQKEALALVLEEDQLVDLSGISIHDKGSLLGGGSLDNCQPAVVVSTDNLSPVPAIVVLPEGEDMEYDYDYDDDDDYQYEINDDDVISHCRTLLASQEFSDSLINKFVFSDDCILDAIDYWGNDDIMGIIDLLLHNYNLAFATISQPCINLIKSGTCYLKNCAFNHSLSDFPCKYWMSIGGCTSGSQCNFQHLLLPIPTTATSSSSLSSSLPTSLVSLEFSQENFPSTLVQAEKGPYKPSSLSSINFKAALSSTSKSADKGGNSAMGSKSFIDDSSRPYRMNSSRYQVFGQNEWVLGIGEDLKKDYAKYREGARRAAIARNRLLEEATKAYTSGNKQNAKLLSAQGKELNAEMHSLHALAATRIFQHRNPLALLKENKIDLHGLHVEESMIIFEEILYLRDDKSNITAFCKSLQLDMLDLDAQIYIITGSGNHSASTAPPTTPLWGKSGGSSSGGGGGSSKKKKAIESKILSSIIEYCEYYKISYTVIRDHNKHAGGIII